jgi:hypothetical protein
MASQQHTIVLLMIVCAVNALALGAAHPDPRHRLHSSSSASNRSIFGEQGRVTNARSTTTAYRASRG